MLVIISSFRVPELVSQKVAWSIAWMIRIGVLEQNINPCPFSYRLPSLVFACKFFWGKNAYRLMPWVWNYKWYSKSRTGDTRSSNWMSKAILPIILFNLVAVMVDAKTVWENLISDERLMCHNIIQVCLRFLIALLCSTYSCCPNVFNCLLFSIFCRITCVC